MKKYLQKVFHIFLIPTALLATPGEVPHGGLSEWEMWNTLGASMRDNLQENNRFKEDELFYDWRISVQDDKGVVPWLCMQTREFLSTLGELVRHSRPSAVTQTVRVKNLNQEDLTRAVRLMGDVRYCHVLLPYLMETDDQWLLAYASLLKDVERSVKVPGAILCCDAYGFLSYDRVAEEVIKFLHGGGFSLARLETLASCHFQTVELQTILAHEEERGALYSEAVLDELSQILGSNFLRTVDDKSSSGMLRYEVTEQVLKRVDSKGTDYIKSFVHFVDVFDGKGFFPFRIKSEPYLFNNIDFINACTSEEKQLLLRCSEMSFSWSSALNFVKNVQREKSDIKDLLTCSHLLLAHKKRTSVDSTLPQEMCEALETLEKGCTEKELYYMKRAIRVKGLQECPPIASLGLSSHLRVPALCARDWLFVPSTPSAPSSSSSLPASTQVDPERLDLFTKLLEGCEGEVAIALAQSLEKCQDTQRLRDLVACNLPPEWRGRILQRYCIMHLIDQNHLRALSILLGRWRLSETLITDLVTSQNFQDMNLEVLSQMVSLPLSQKGMESLIKCCAHYSMEAWLPFKEALEEVILHCPEKVHEFMSKSPSIHDKEYPLKLTSLKQKFLEETSGAANSFQAGSSS